MSQEPKKKRGKNLCRARLRNQPAGGGIYHFALVREQREKNGDLKQPAGVLVQQKHRSKEAQKLVSLDEIVSDRGMEFMFPAGAKHRAILTEEGIKIRRAGFKKWKLVQWGALVDRAVEEAEAKQFNLIDPAATLNKTSGAKNGR